MQVGLQEPGESISLLRLSWLGEAALTLMYLFCKFWSPSKPLPPALTDAVYRHDSLGLCRDFMSLCVKQIKIQCEILLLLKTPLPTAAHHSVAAAALAASGATSQ